MTADPAREFVESTLNWVRSEIERMQAMPDPPANHIVRMVSQLTRILELQVKLARIDHLEHSKARTWTPAIEEIWAAFLEVPALRGILERRTIQMQIVELLDRKMREAQDGKAPPEIPGGPPADQPPSEG
jgi:hypothetical protein